MTEVSGILKGKRKETVETVEQKRNKGIKWDEDNLNMNEEEKVPRMKIDEPPTPYHSEDKRFSSDEEEAFHSQELDCNPRKRFSFSEQAIEKGSFESDEWENDEDEQQLTPEEIEKERIRRQEFAAKRKAHYNEFIASKQILSQEDEDEDEDEEKDQLNKPSLA